MTTRTTYNFLRRGIATLALVCISVITFAQEQTNVAKIGNTEYATLQLAIDAANASETATEIVLLQSISTGTETYTISKQITLNLGEFTITGNHTNNNDKMFAITSTTGNLTVTGNGSIQDNDVRGIFYNEGTLAISSGTYTTTNNDGYAVIYNTGSTANCTVSGGSFTGAYAAVYNVSEATMTVSEGTFSAPSFGIVTRSGSTLNINAGSSTVSSTNSTGAGINVVDANTTATISGGTITGHNGVFIMTNAKLIVNDGATIIGSNASISGRGNAGEGNTTITINGGIITSTDDTGIYHPQVGTLTINGGTITGGKLGVEIRAGEISVTGGSITATADTYYCVANTNGTTTIGAALAIAQHTTKQNISVTISGGEFTGVKAISESNPQQNDPAPQVTMEVTDGTFHGGITVVDVQDGFISGGTYSTVDENFGNYLKSGFVVKTNTGATPTTYTVEPEVKVEVSSDITEESKVSAAAALAGNTSVSETTGLGGNGSLDVTITGVTLDANNNVTSATFEVTAKDANGNAISADGTYTFRLPISSGIAAEKWVNLKHNGTPIPASQVVADGDNRYVAVTTTSFSPFEYQVLLNDPVAQIGETKYETITEAIAEAPNNTATTIELLADITTDFEVTAGKNIILTIDEYTISGNITNAGTLAISDGTISGNITNTSTISITGGTFTNEPESGWIADGYEVMVGAESKYIVATAGTAETQIGEVKYQTIALAIAAVSTNAEDATTIVVLKNIETAFEISADKKIALSVTTNTISGDVTNNGTLTISDGTFTGAITNNNEEEGSLTITGGTFTNKPNSYTCEEGYDLIINENGVYVVTDVTVAEAEIDGDMYKTIGDAIAAASTATITLLKDLEGEDRSITIPAGANITLIVANEVTLTKPINVEGKLAITSGTISETTLTITDFNAVVKITDGVTHPAVALSSELQTENVLKSKAEGEPAITTYWAKKKFEAKIDEGITEETPEWSAANDLIANTSIKEVTGHATNQSLTITVTSVTLGTDSKVTMATFEVKLIGTDGEEVTGTVPEVTFHLPVSDGLDGKWANLWHNETAIPGMNVVGAANGYVTITTTSFSPFRYEIIETPIAQIGETKYASVENAITAVTASLAEATEIILVGTEAAVAEAITVGTNKNVKLTIGTHTLADDITNAGTLTIADGTIEGAEKTITNTGALTISGGTISNPVTATAGTLAISGGTFSAAITTSETAGLNISNGAITGALTVGGSGTNTISGGTISGAVTTNTATTISGGTFDAASSITNGGALSITGGIFEFSTAITNNSPGTVAISGGTHTVLPVSGFCATGYMPIKNDAGKYEITNHWTITDATVIDGSHFEYLTSSNNYSVATATYYRNTGMVSAGNTHTKYGTICLPFNITAAPTGMTLYKATSITDTELTITEVTDFSTPIPVGTPLIFELSAEASSMTVTSSNAAVMNTTAPETTPATDILLVGTYTELNLTEALNTKYYLNGDHFHQAVQSLKVPAFRAYIEYTGSQSAPAILTITKETEETEETTAIEDTNTEAGIVAIYDAMGHKFGSLQKGMNIVLLTNGKTMKVIVK